MGIEELEKRVAMLERGRRRIASAAAAALATSSLLIGGLVLMGAAPAAAPLADAALAADSVLRVRGLVIVDASGVERVIIGAPVPDPLIYGRRGSRLGTATGILLMDADGNERSGYVTTDELGEVVLTLDAAASQQALFLANATGGANLVMWDHDGNAAQLAAVQHPILTLRQKGKVVTSLPDTMETAR